LKKISTFCFDLDGVICNNTYGKYDEAKPYPKAINKINNLFSDGHYIIIFTARYMGRFKNDSSKAINYGYQYFIIKIGLNISINNQKNE